MTPLAPQLPAARLSQHAMPGSGLPWLELHRFLVLTWLVPYKGRAALGCTNASRAKRVKEATTLKLTPLHDTQRHNLAATPIATTRRHAGRHLPNIDGKGGGPAEEDAGWTSEAGEQDSRALKCTSVSPEFTPHRCGSGTAITDRPVPGSSPCTCGHWWAHAPTSPCPQQ